MSSAISRRQFTQCLAAAPAILRPSSNAIQVTEVEPSYQDYHYRAPMKFGGSVVTRVTLLNVRCTVRGRTGQVAHGFGSMPLGNVWSFSSKKLTYDQTLQAMKDLAAQITKLTTQQREWGHPIDLNVALQPQFLQAAADISSTLAQPIPELCTIVTASPFDAAIHDAYGNCITAMPFKRSVRSFFRARSIIISVRNFAAKRSIGTYFRPRSQPCPSIIWSARSIPSHRGKFPIRCTTGCPETLPEWIRYNGITHIKIKLNGDDRNWDLERVIRVHNAASNTGRQHVYSLDFNEKCPNVEYLVDFLKELKSRSPAAYGRLQYVEQPTARDLKANPRNQVHAAAKLIPVVIDESLTGKDAFVLALEMGYSGAALKACKGQSEALLMAALGQKRKVFLCVQDLTCPGASLVHSVSLAAHVEPVQAIEANARQYVPDANRGWEKRFPGIFAVKDGVVHTAGIDGPGSGAV